MDALKQRPLLIITILAALMRLPTLAIESLWYDEAFTAWLATLPLNNLIAAALGDVHPPTWYLIEWSVVRALGTNEIALRLVSVFAGIALVPMVWRLAGLVGIDRAAQGAAALVTAVAPFAVYYSQEARAYSLLYLLLGMAAVALLEQRWLWFALAAVFALYLHNLAVLSLAAIAWLGLYRYWRNPWLYASFGLIGLAWLPWLIYGLVTQLGAVAGSFWVRPPTYGTPVFVLVSLFWSEKALLLAWVTVPLLAVALFKARPHLELLALLLLPISLALIISVLVTPILLPRVVGFAAIPLYLILGSALLPAPAAPPASAAPILQSCMLPILMALVLTAFYATYWLTDRIGRYPWDFGLPPNVVIRSTDGIFHANLATYIVYHYYSPNEQYLWPQANDLSQSLTDQTKAAMQMRQAQFENVACNHRRWWLAFYENPTTDPAEQAEVARIIKRYHGQQVTTILKNQLVNARIYRLGNVCHQTVGIQ